MLCCVERNKNFLIKSTSPARPAVDLLASLWERDRKKKGKGGKDWSRTAGEGTEVERKRRRYDARLDFAVCLVGAYRMSILFLFVLYVNLSPVGAQGQHQSMADGG